MPTGENLTGRPKGVLNKTTRKFKDALVAVYDDLGGNTAFAAWARENPTEFYRLCAKLIPAQESSNGNQFAGGVTIVIGSVADKREAAGVIIDNDTAAVVERVED